ncbi:MAG TPA: hypothetical protein VF599_15130 [Pyrinomonadaceae bacterium]|jgi:hypothetical protein
MKIENDFSFIEFELEDRYETYIGCRVKVFSRGFGGEVENVTFHVEDIKSFFQQIEELDKTRKGCAELLNLSSPSYSSPLKFIIFSTDSLGHLAAQAALQKTIYLGNHYIEGLKTSVTFDFDSGLLASIINNFKKLFMV